MNRRCIMIQAESTIDQEKVGQMAQQMFGEMTATGSVFLGALGAKLGLWQALAGAGALTSAEVADRSGCAERYVREWLAAQAAGGYLSYDPVMGRFTLSDEAAALLADEA